MEGSFCAAVQSEPVIRVAMPGHQATKAHRDCALNWTNWTCQCAVHCSFSSVQITLFGQNFVKKPSFDECFGVWYCKSYVPKDLTRSGSLFVSPLSTVSGSLGRKPRNLVHTHVLICALKDQHYGHICEEINFWSTGQQPGGLWSVILCIHFWLELYA